MRYDFYIENPIHHSDLLRAHNLNDESLPMQFFRAAVYAGAQQPVSGIVQIVDKAAGTNLLPKVQLIDPCQKADFGTLNWHTQQFGAMLGVTFDLMCLNKVVGGASNLIAGQIEHNAENEGALAFRTIAEAGATGFIHNGFFRPVSADEGDFITARINNALVGAGTFATLTAGSLGVKYIGKAQDNILGSMLRSDIGATVISGIPGGFAYAEMKSLADGKGWATGNSIGQAVYSFSVLGGAFAGAKEVFGRTHSEEGLYRVMQTLSAKARAKESP